MPEIRFFRQALRAVIYRFSRGFGFGCNQASTEEAAIETWQTLLTLLNNELRCS